MGSILLWKSDLSARATSCFENMTWMLIQCNVTCLALCFEPKACLQHHKHVPLVALSPSNIKDSSVHIINRLF